MISIDHESETKKGFVYYLKMSLINLHRGRRPKLCLGDKYIKDLVSEMSQVKKLV